MTKDKFVGSLGQFVFKSSCFNVSEFGFNATRCVQFLDAKCNVDNIIQILFTDLPSVTRITKCSKCDYMQCRNLRTLCINVEIVLKKGFNYIQEAIDDTENLNVSQVLCKKCCANLERIHEYGSHIS